MYYINTCNGSKYLYVEQQARISSLESNSLQMEVPLTKHNQSVTSRVSYRLLLIDACRASVCSRPYAAAGVSAAAGAGSRASLERASVASRNYLMAGVAPRPPYYHLVLCTQPTVSLVTIIYNNSLKVRSVPFALYD